MIDIISAMNIIHQAQERPDALNATAVSDAIDEVVRVTAETYTRESAAYAQAREAQPWERDAYMNKMLLDLVRSKIASGKLAGEIGGRWRLLDVGAGYGRDVLRFLAEPDIEPVALENSEGFITYLRTLQESGRLGPRAVIQADMRDMSVIPSATFHCVRNHATLHHLPVVMDGYGADVAIAESRRVLVRGGVLYILVKAGSGIRMIDTGEGLGGRFFQLFTCELLRTLLERHCFSIVHMETLVEPRGSSNVEWIFSLATTA